MLSTAAAALRQKYGLPRMGDAELSQTKVVPLRDALRSAPATTAAHTD